MVHAGDFEVRETLRNGLCVTFRAVRPGDKAGLAEAFGKLDAASVYTRFFQAKASLSEEELKEATEVDFEGVVALVVTVVVAGAEVIIGGGRYLALEREGVRSAEIAFLVEEDYHGLGIAGLLLGHLAGIARGKGVARFEAEVLSQNRAMLSVFSRSGLPMTVTEAEGVIHVTLGLGG